MESELSDKVFVVTGATSGIGLALTEALVRRQATVIGVGRSDERSREARERIQRAQPGSRVEFQTADLSIQREVRSLAEGIRAQLSAWGPPALDGLVNNAGTFTFWQTLTPEGFEMQWAVNHLAPFLLTHQLLPLLRQAPAARVVTVSSGSHYGAKLDWEDVQQLRHYNPVDAYKRTKLANVLFTAEFNRRQANGSRVRAFAADPGLVATDIGAKAGVRLARVVWNMRKRAGISPQEAAQGILDLLADPTVQDSGEVYWKHGKPKAASPEALDRDAARRLWELSERMCGLTAEEEA